MGFIFKYFSFTVGFRDGNNFNPRFDGPPPDDFFRGPGGPRMRPPMFNEGPGRFRGHRFDDRNWDRPNSEFENHIENPPPIGRQVRRSRWGHGDEDNEQGFEEEGSTEFNRGLATPVYDEFPQPEGTTDENRGGHEDNQYFEGNEFRGANQEEFEPESNGRDESQGNFSNQNQEQYEENISNMQDGGKNYHEGNTDFQNDDTFQSGDNYIETADHIQGRESFAQDCEDNGQAAGINFQEGNNKHVEGSDLQELGDGSHEANTEDREEVYQSPTDGNEGEPATD